MPDDFGAADPVTLNVDVEVVAEGRDPLWSVASREPIPSLMADGSGLYWYDVNGTVFARRHGETEVVELLAGVESVYERVAQGQPAPVVVSLVAGADRLYAGEAHAIEAVEYLVAAPPSRLLSIPKQGGPASVLLESENELLVPIAVDGERLIVQGQAADAMLHSYQVDLANPALVPLPPEPVHGPVSFMGGALYWTDSDVLSGRVIYSNNYAFSLCPGYYLARHTAQLDTLFLEDAESGRQQAFARIGVRIDNPVCDERHVYFYSFGGSGRIVDEQQLVRVDVQSGQLARLVSPSLTLQSDFAILGDDAENVYVNNGYTLLAIRKP